MIRAIAIDDEPVALEVIRNFATRIPFLELTEVFTNAFDAMPLIKKDPVDLVFLDIRMPDISGIEWARSLVDPPMIIFTTAYSEHAVESFDLEAVDYLLKPFSFERFLKAVNKAHTSLELRTQEAATGSFFIRSGTGQVRIDINEILFVQSAGNYVQFQMRNEKILSRLTMSEALAILPVSGFLRIHRSYIVPVKKMRKFDRNNVWVEQFEIPVGQGYSDELMKLMKGK